MSVMVTERVGEMAGILEHVFEVERRLLEGRRLRLRYLADAIREDEYPIEATEVAQSMLRIVGHA